MSDSNNKFKITLPWAPRPGERDLINLDGSPYHFTQQFPEGWQRNTAKFLTSPNNWNMLFPMVFDAACEAFISDKEKFAITVVFSVCAGLTLRCKRYADWHKIIAEQMPEIKNPAIDKSGLVSAVSVNQTPKFVSLITELVSKNIDIRFLEITHNLFHSLEFGVLPLINSLAIAGLDILTCHVKTIPYILPLYGGLYFVASADQIKLKANGPLLPIRRGVLQSISLPPSFW